MSVGRQHVSQNTRHSREAGEAPRNGHYEALTQPGGYLWPELRIGREADFREAYEWDGYINVLGNQNRRRGNALPLGQYACHYVTDTEMRGMIFKQNPTLRRDRKGAREVYRDIASSTNGLIRSMGAAAHRKILEGSYAEQPGVIGDSGRRKLALPPDYHWLPAEMALKEGSSAFTGYDGNKLGIDLSANRELRDERREILEHLRREHRLDTTEVRRDWEPHITIFEMHPHLAHDAVVMVQPTDEPMPQAILLDQPKAFFDRYSI